MSTSTLPFYVKRIFLGTKTSTKIHIASRAQKLLDDLTIKGIEIPGEHAEIAIASPADLEVVHNITLTGFALRMSYYGFGLCAHNLVVPLLNDFPEQIEGSTFIIAMKPINNHAFTITRTDGVQQLDVVHTPPGPHTYPLGCHFAFQKIS